MTTKSPAFQFYAHDFLAGRVATYSLEEAGAYSLLLAFDWSLNGLPNQPEILAKLCRVSSRRFNKIWLVLAEQFPPGEDGKLRNPRLQAERDKQVAYSESMSANGKKGGRPKKPQESRGKAAVKPEESSPSPTPSPITTTTQDAVFVEAWAAYPKRPGNSRADSYTQWLRRVKEGVDPLDMLEGTRRYARFVVAEGTEPRYRKQAQTFYGPGRHFENDWTPSGPADPLTSRVAEVVAEEDAAIERTMALLKSRGAA